MERTTCTSTSWSSGAGARASLRETVGAFAADVQRLKRELAEAHREIARLRHELRPSPAASRGRPEPLSSLRRRICSHCHPDRGGDGELMKEINALFDLLQQIDAVV